MGGTCSCHLELADQLTFPDTEAQSFGLLDPKLCYLLDGILFLYGVIITALYLRVKVGASGLRVRRRVDFQRGFSLDGAGGLVFMGKARTGHEYIPGKQRGGCRCLAKQI